MGQQSIIWLLEYDTEILNKNNEHLIKLNCLLNYITEIILFIDVAYGQAEIIVRDILRQYNSKINLIDDSSNCVNMKVAKISILAKNSLNF